MITLDFSRLYECINPCYHQYVDDFRRYQIYKGSAGSGKSVFNAQKFIYNFATIPGYNLMCLRNVNKDNHDSTFAELTKVINQWGLDSFLKINKAKGNELIENPSNRNQIIFRGMDDPEKIKSITFPNGPLVGIWFEEGSEFDEEDFDLMDLRLRGSLTTPHHIVISFNPIDESHWLKKRFFDYPLEPQDGYICETTYLQNQFLDDAYRAKLESYKDKDYYLYMVYCLNQWGYRTGTTVFHNIKVHNFDIPEHNMYNIRHGLDFGYNHATALMGNGYQDGEMYIFREEYAKRKLNHEFINMVNESGYPKDYPIFADSANPDKIAEFNREGYKVTGATKGPGSLMRGVDYLKGLKTIHIHKSNCPNAAREFLKFKYKQIKDGTILDEVVEIDDDTIAAVRYANEEFFNTGERRRLTRKSPFTRKLT